MSQESDNEKTEDPTPQRRESARKKGQIARSKELTSLLMLLAGWGLMLGGGERMLRHLSDLLHGGLVFDRLLTRDPALMLQRAAGLLGLAMMALLPLLAGLWLTAVSAPSLIGGLNLSGKALKPAFKKLNPLSGLKRMFSRQMAAEMIKALLKVLLATVGAGTWLLLHRERFIRLIFEPTGTALADISSLVSSCMLAVLLSLVPMVAFDVIYQLLSQQKKLRMSRQEIKDEFKKQEGDPQIKSRVRQMQRAMAQQRMMSEVPTADVVVNNPTHYAVALKYQENSMGAPKVVARGSGLVALRIRELAESHRVPMLTAPPLARALYRHCETGDPIPADLYNAVAEVLAWVYGLKRWRQSGGPQPVSPVNLPVPEALDFSESKK